jgi:2-iminobutanoate/2-iminopropanoate deaminase
MRTPARTALTTTAAPQPIGPFSQGVVSPAGALVFVSGQVGADPVSGQLADGVVAQARRALDNAGAVLAAAGLDFSHVVKTTIYLADLADFGRVNEIYAGYFTAPAPARTTIQAAALPLGARVEVDVIAVARAM